MNIIILQTSFPAQVTCREVLKKLRMTDGKDYKIFDSIAGVEDSVIPGKRQLFITGSFFGSHGGVAAFTQLLREKNTELICLSFSIDVLDGPFDGAIQKTGDVALNLAIAIKAFDLGITKRTAASHRGKSFSYTEYERTIGAAMREPEMVALDLMFKTLYTGRR